jgi:PPOX class probable F420-dependent enzyme
MSTVNLTTYKKDGTGVETKVSLVIDGEHRYFRTWDTAWKARRLRNNPAVEIDGVPGRARLLEGAEARRARKALSRQHPVLHRFVVPAFHRLTGKKTVHYEVTPT